MAPLRLLQGQGPPQALPSWEELHPTPWPAAPAHSLLSADPPRWCLQRCGCRTSANYGGWLVTGPPVARLRQCELYRSTGVGAVDVNKLWRCQTQQVCSPVGSRCSVVPREHAAGLGQLADAVPGLANGAGMMQRSATLAAQVSMLQQVRGSSERRCAVPLGKTM
jgi:hypothetical protein